MGTCSTARRRKAPFAQGKAEKRANWASYRLKNSQFRKAGTGSGSKARQGKYLATRMDTCYVRLDGCDVWALTTLRKKKRLPVLVRMRVLGVQGCVPCPRARAALAPIHLYLS